VGRKGEGGVSGWVGEGRGEMGRRGVMLGVMGEGDIEQVNRIRIVESLLEVHSGPPSRFDLRQARCGQKRKLQYRFSILSWLQESSSKLQSSVTMLS
jgi:hypothetical protein